MSFLQPALAVAAVVGASLPFLLHLLLRRPRATAWPSTMLLRQALERLRRRRRLEQWVLLALRSLALALAGLGMAGPVARALQAGRPTRELWVVIDDGATSAERLPDGSRALDAVRAGARRELDGLQAGDRAALVTAARPSSVRVQPTTDIERVRREMDALQPRAVPADLAQALEQCLPSDALAAGRDVLLASSLRRGSVDAASPLPASWKARAQGVRWISLRPFESSPANRGVTAVAVGRGPGEVTGTGETPVRVHLARQAGADVVDPVLVRGATGDLLGRADAAWGIGATELRQDVRARAPKDGALRVEMSPDAQPLDDTMVAVSAISGPPRVCVLGRRSGDADVERLPASTWIVRALESAGIQPQEADPSTLALRPPREIDVMIVARPDMLDAAGWAWLGRFTRDGGTTVVMPVPDLPSQAWMGDADRSLAVGASQATNPQQGSWRLAARQPRTPLLSLLGAEIDALSEPVSVQRRWPLQVTGAETQPVLVFEDGTPAVVASRPRDGTGVTIRFAVAPEITVTDLPLKPLMVPLFQEIARAGRVLAASQQACASGEVAWLGSSAAGGLVRAADGGAVIEIDAEGRTTRPLPSAGLWKVEQRDGRQRWVAARLDPKAASIERVEPDALQAWRNAVGPWQWSGEGAGKAADADTSGTSPFTPALLASALVLLLAECAWSRRGSPRRQPIEARA